MILGNCLIKNGSQPFGLLINNTPTRFSGNPIIPHVLATFKAGQTMEAHVMTNPADATQLVMYYCGQLQGGTAGNIVRATAQLSNPYVWADTHTTILVCGAGGTWDANMVRMDSLVYDSGTYYIYYTGRNAGSNDQIGLATSADGTTFTKHASNPLLTPTAPETDVSQASVLKEGANWYMWYAHRDGADVLPNIKLATSSDGVSWTKTGTIAWPKGDSGLYDDTYVEYHQVFKYSGYYYMVVECYDGDVWSIGLGYSKSPTGVFTKLSNPIFQKSDVSGAFDEFHVATPTIFQINGKWYLFYQGANLYDPYTGAQWDIGMAEYTPGPYWWLPTGLSAANCIAAYQPKGANSLALSYRNLVRPGTNDAFTGTAPTFATATGWTFDGSTQYLKTGVIPTNDQAYSVLVRFSDVTSAGGRWMIGAGEGTNRYFGIQPIDDAGPANVGYLNGTQVRVSPSLTGGVLGIAGNRGYRNGTVEGGTIGAWEGASALPIFMGATNWQGDATAFCACKIQAFAIYNTTLSPAQMAEVSAAMAAL